jgi:uncharacterized protein (DUF342 family)
LNGLLREKALLERIGESALSRVPQLLGECGESAGQSRRIELPLGTTHAAAEPRIIWQSFSIPAELEAEAKRGFSSAPRPVVYDPYPAQPDAEETAGGKAKGRAGREKGRAKTPVTVDPLPVAVGFVRKGDLIAKVPGWEEGLPGGPDDTVAGARFKRVALYLGERVVRMGAGILSDSTGFLRRGSEWVEVLPFLHHLIKVYRSKDQATCLMDFTPGKGRLPDPAEILNQAIALGFAAETLVKAAEISRLMKESRLRLVEAEPLSLPRDAVCDVTVSPDRLEASLHLCKGRGTGKPLSLAETGRAIRDCSLKGLDTKKIRSDILTFYRGKEEELIDYPLAKGNPPVRGKDGELKYTATLLPDSEASEIKERLAAKSSSFWQNGKDMPFSPSERLAIVKKDQKVSELIPPSAGQAGLDVRGEAIPAIVGNDPDLRIYKNLRISKNFILASVAGLLRAQTAEGVYRATVTPYGNATFEINTSEDRMEATIRIEPAEGGGRPLEEQPISEALDAAGVRKGIDIALLRDLLSRSKAGEMIPDTAVARGQPPKHGSGSRLQFHSHVASGRSLYSRHADGSGRGGVKKDDLIAEIHPPTVKPEDGWDITGRVIPANPAIVIEIDMGKNVRREQTKQGLVRLLAGRDGEVFYDGNTLDIKDILVINEGVSRNTGDVKFSGSVEVNGSVEPGSRVFAGGDLTVAGSVSGALLSSEATIRIKQGVRGGGRAVLRAKSEVNAVYVEDATVLAVGDVRIRNSCLKSTVKCNGKLSFGSDRGTLIGGTARCRQGVSVVNLGSAMGLPTLISFGQDYLVADRIELEEKEIEKLKTAIADSDNRMREIGSQAQSDGEALNAVRKEKLRAMKLMEKRSMGLFSLREKFEKHYPAGITIRGDLFPGVVVESHSRYYEVSEKKRGVALYFDLEHGKIQERTM